MKLKQVILTVALPFALLSTAAHADIMFQSQKTGGNICDNIAGAWGGSGTVSAKIVFKFTCEYQGTGVAIPKSAPYNYDFKVNLQKTKGICPDVKETVLPGFCDPVAGRLVLRSSEADLSGTLSPDGRYANVVGKINMSVMGSTVTANVERMELRKQ